MWYSMYTQEDIFNEEKLELFDVDKRCVCNGKGANKD